MDIIDDYNKKGYILFDKEPSNQQSNSLNKIVDNLEPKTFVPYSEKVPWGYGNLIENQEILEILNLGEKLKKASIFLKKGNLICNHILITNKAPFIGPDVEWHQEFLNIDSYAPGYDIDKDFNNFAQLYMAIDEHTVNNGTLYVFEGSHKEGILPSEDIINSHLNHKRRIKYSTLESISSKYELKPLLLKPGQSVLFNHLLVHGSPTNCSPSRRRALLMQFRVCDKEKNQNLFDLEVKHRTEFILNEMKKKYDKLSQTNIYSDFNKK